MTLLLKHVPAQQGAVWVRDGVRTFLRHPLAFLGLQAVSFLAVRLVWAIPFVGDLIVVAAVPMLSAGYMIASHQALQGHAVHPAQLIEPLRRGDASRRRAMLTLCFGFLAAVVLISQLSGWLDGGRSAAAAAAVGAPSDTATVEAAMQDPALLRGTFVWLLLMGGLSVPFWHAPALVWWGGQGAAHSLFSSTLAVWRNRGAFAVYGLVWMAVMIGVSVVLSLVLGAFGLAEALPVLGTVLLPVGLTLAAAFYVSVLFTFNDSFAATPIEKPAVEPNAAG